MCHLTLNSEFSGTRLIIFYQPAFARKRISFSDFNFCTWHCPFILVRLKKQSSDELISECYTCYPFNVVSATAAKSIQQAVRMWAGRAGRGVIGRPAGTQWWRPTHSANERRADRTRDRPTTGATLPAFQKKNTRFDLLRTPGFFFVWPRYHSGTRIEVLIR